MTLADLIRRLDEAGAPAAAIAIAVEAVEDERAAAQAAVEARRAKDAMRKRKSRAGPSQDVTGQAVTETDADVTERDEGGRACDKAAEPPLPPSPLFPPAPPELPPNPPTPPERGRRGTRLPAEMTLPEEWIRWAQAEGHPDPDREWQRFRDYWIAKPGKDGTKLDWFATWRTWIRRTVDDGKRKGNRAEYRNGFAAVAADLLGEA